MATGTTGSRRNPGGRGAGNQVEPGPARTPNEKETMMNSLKKQWMVGLTATLLGGVAWAQTAAPGTASERGVPGLPPALAMLDTDGDGRLSGEELAKAGDVLRALDRDGDGAIDPDELRGRREPVGPGPGRGITGDRPGRAAGPGLGVGQRGPRPPGARMDRGQGPGRNRGDRIQSDDRASAGPPAAWARRGPQFGGGRGNGWAAQGGQGWRRSEARPAPQCPCCQGVGPGPRGGGGWRGGPRG